MVFTRPINKNGFELRVPDFFMNNVIDNRLVSIIILPKTVSRWHLPEELSPQESQNVES